MNVINESLAVSVQQSIKNHWLASDIADGWQGLPHDRLARASHLAVSKTEAV